MNISTLVGKTLTDIERVGNERIVFTTDQGERFALHHDQDCCESVTIEDICGDLFDLLQSPILSAEEVTGETAQPAGWAPDEWCESFTWTFYKIDTSKGGVTIRWLGESNGFYSERVDFSKAREDGTPILWWQAGEGDSRE